MFVQHLTNHRGHKTGARIWCSHGGVRKTLITQGIYVLDPDQSQDGKGSEKPDANTSTKQDDSSPAVVGSDASGSETPSKTARRPKRVRQRADANDQDGSTGSGGAG